MPNRTYSFINEREGQIDFYNTILPRIDPNIEIDDILADYNDGVLNGNLLEFKLSISNLNEHLFQCIKYLSKLRINGKPVPANILIIDLSRATVRIYDSEPYLEAIEVVYIGGASRNNQNFTGGDNPIKTLRYDDDTDTEELIELLRENRFTKINRRYINPPYYN